MKALTPRQMSIAVYFRRYLVEHGYSPTMDEAAGVLGVSKVTIFEHLNSLERKGLVTRTPNKSRSIRLTDEALAQLPPDDMTTDIAAREVLTAHELLEEALPLLPPGSLRNRVFAWVHGREKVVAARIGGGG